MLLAPPIAEANLGTLQLPTRHSSDRLDELIEHSLCRLTVVLSDEGIGLGEIASGRGGEDEPHSGASARSDPPDRLVERQHPPGREFVKPAADGGILVVA